MKGWSVSPGFTLIEVLVVLGLIALLAGTFAVGSRETVPAHALESAQATVGALLSAARHQATLHRNRVMLVVDADLANDRFLRGIQVAVETAPNSGHWWITEHGALLAEAIRVVPGSAELGGATLAPAAPGPGQWPPLRRSSFEIIPPGSISGRSGDPLGQFLGLVIPLPGFGPPGGGGGEKIVLAAPRRLSTGVVFEHPQQIRGLVLSAYGVPLLVNDAPGFDF